MLVYSYNVNVRLNSEDQAHCSHTNFAWMTFDLPCSPLHVTSYHVLQVATRHCTQSSHESKYRSPQPAHVTLASSTCCLGFGPLRLSFLHVSFFCFGSFSDRLSFALFFVEGLLLPTLGLLSPNLHFRDFFVLLNQKILVWR